MTEGESWGWPPTGSALNLQREDHWKHFDNSVNAVSFGFVATAILISMFLVMAIFERFLRPASSSSSSLSPSGGRRRADLESQMGFHGKLGHPSPKMSIYAKGVSVLMPGEHVPTFIAHPVPVPCAPERTPWPPHQHYNSLPNPTPSSNQNTNATLNSATSE